MHSPFRSSVVAPVASLRDLQENALPWEVGTTPSEVAEVLPASLAELTGLPGYAFDLNADAGVTPTTAAGDLSTWTDQGASIAFSKGGYATTPSFSATGLNGKAAVAFASPEAIQNTLSFTFTDSVITDISNMSVYVLLNVQTVTNPGFYFFVRDPTVNNFVLGVNASNFTIQDSAGTRTVGSASTGIQVFSVMVAGGGLEWFVNNASIGTTTYTPGVFAAANVGINADQNGNNSTNFILRRLLIYNATHSSAMRGAISGLLETDGGV